MPSVQQGRSITLTVQWQANPADPTPVDVANVQLRITPSAGGTDVRATSSTGIVHVATGLDSYTWAVASDLDAADYEWIWTGDGGVQASETVTVTASLEGSHATAGDLADWVDPVPDNAAILLRRASRDVDQALLTSVYDTDDADVLAALRDATCEQVAGQLAAGATTGIGAAAPASFSLGKLTVNRGAGGANPAAQARKIRGLWEQAWQILQQAGLTGHEPRPW